MLQVVLILEKMKLVFQWTSGSAPELPIQLGQTQFNKMVLEF